MRKRLTPDDLGDLLELPLVAVLATYRRDSTVLLSPVWHEWHDNGFHVVTRSGDVKAGHLQRDPRASLSSPEDHSIVRRIATRYLGPEAGGQYADTGADNLLIRLEPGELRAWDFADDFA